MIKKQKLRNIPLENIIAVSQFFECNMTKENICAFFEEAEYENQIQFGKKTKQNMFSFSLDQLKNGLKL